MKKLYLLFITVFISVNLHAQWEAIYWWSPILPYLTDVEFVDYHKGMAIGVNTYPSFTPRILTTNDYGTNWVTVFTSNSPYYLDKMETPDSNTAIAIGSNWNNNNGIILRTTDFGYTWDSTFTNEMLYSVFFPSQSIGYITGSNGGFYKTTDSGYSWSQSFPFGNNYIYSSFFIDDTVGYVCCEYNVYKTTDGGNNWTTSLTSTHNNQYVFFPSYNVGYCAQLDTSFYLYKTIDAGNTWNLQFSIQSGIMGLSGIYFLDDYIGYLNFTHGIMKTINGGATFNLEDCINYSSCFIDDHPGIDFVDAQNGYIVGWGQFYRLNTSITENKELQTNELSIFPNPTTSLVTIQAENISRIEVMDITGKHLTGFQNLEGLKEIDLSPQPQGIYIIRVTTDKQTITQKVIKQ